MTVVEKKSKLKQDCHRRDESAGRDMFKNGKKCEVGYKRPNGGKREHIYYFHDNGTIVVFNSVVLIGEFTG